MDSCFGPCLVKGTVQCKRQADIVRLSRRDLLMLNIARDLFENSIWLSRFIELEKFSKLTVVGLRGLRGLNVRQLASQTRAVVGLKNGLGCARIQRHSMAAALVRAPMFKKAIALLFVQSWMVDGMHGPPGPTAGQIVNITVGVRAPVPRLPMEANIASVETLCQQIAPVECVALEELLLPKVWISPMKREQHQVTSLCWYLLNNANAIVLGNDDAEGPVVGFRLPDFRLPSSIQTVDAYPVLHTVISHNNRMIMKTEFHSDVPVRKPLERPQETHKNLSQQNFQLGRAVDHLLPFISPFI
ncbi:hypothetical protein GHT06_022214 [Daphnia sinensis]|uniref:Uncharacterized protein n=1 Tax=Daphnia sinensis TaxID=1820382 RepID=A0AAD5PNH1_9CRUS|nr:hypothetical protein GHT06_022214 [Daphnia sinensis]